MAQSLPRGKSTRPFYMGLLVVVLFVGLIALAELLLWAVGFESLRQRMAAQGAGPVAARPKALVDDAELGWVPSPGFDGEIEGIRYRINSLGFRGDDIDREKPKGALRVLCLGDSTTYGVMVEGRRIYTSVLERKLSEMLAPRRVEVINGGVPGYSSFQASLFLSDRCFELEPDIITLCVGLNDSFLTPVFCRSDSEQYVPWRRAAYRAKLALGRSGLFTLLDRLIQRAMSRSSSPARKEEPGQGMKRRVTLEEYRANLLEIAQKCEDRDIPLVMFSFSLSDAYADVMRSAAEEVEATFLDIEPLFDRAAEALEAVPIEPGSGSQATVSTGTTRIFAGVYDGMFSEAMLRTHANPALFVDPCHPTALGHGIIAEGLANLIIERRLSYESRNRWCRTSYRGGMPSSAPTASTLTP